MRRRGPTLLGAVLGVAAAMLVIAHGGGRAREPAGGAMLADAGGRVRSVVMQYTAGSQFVLPVYREYLGRQSARLEVILVCPGEADFAELRAGLGSVPPKLAPVYTGHAMTAWSRDRWVPLMAGRAGEPITLLAPRIEEGLEAWPQRAGDGRIAADLAAAFPGRLAARHSGLAFDGGDLLADGGFVFATPAVVERNVQRHVADREGLLKALGAELHLTPVLMEQAPDHHAGMFMMSAGAGADGRRRMVVGDPSLGREVYDAAGVEAAELEGGADLSEEMQGRFDSVARLAAGAGYAVTRMPVVVPRVGKNYLTFVNVILDREGGQGIVYMPTFGGQSRMNAAAARVWEGLGYGVRGIDCSTVWTRGGTLHCLVNVLEREL